MYVQKIGRKYTKILPEIKQNASSQKIHGVGWKEKFTQGEIRQDNNDSLPINCK